MFVQMKKTLNENVVAKRSNMPRYEHNTAMTILENKSGVEPNLARTGKAWVYVARNLTIMPLETFYEIYFENALNRSGVYNGSIVGISKLSVEYMIRVMIAFQSVPL